MILFVLGLIVGIVFCIFNAVLYQKTATVIVRKIKQIESASRPKGSILDPDETEVEEWIDSLKTE